MSKSEGNFIRLNRKLFENPIWKERRVFSRAEAWLDLVQLARYSKEPDTVAIKDRIITCNRGQLVKSLVTLGDRWGWSKTKVKRVLDVFKGRNMIELENVTVTTRITLCNYDTYNTVQNANGTQAERKQNASGTQPSTEEESSKKEERKKKKGKAKSTQELIEFCESIDLLKVDGEILWDKWEGNGWTNRDKKIVDWKATIRSWKRQGFMPSQQNPQLKHEVKPVKFKPIGEIEAY